MAIRYKETTFHNSFKKGKIYGPDDTEGLPRETHAFFDDGDDDELAVRFGEHEYCSSRCIKSFKIKIVIIEEEQF